MSKRARKPKEAEKENAERWLLTYADLITLLLAFFIVMWSMGQTDLKKFDQVRDSLANAFNTGIGDTNNGTSPLFDEGSNFDPSPFGTQQSDLSALQKRFNELAAKYGVADKIKIRAEQNEIVISLSDNLLFDSASATLREESFVVLAETAAILRSLPNEFRIEGHTDNIPINTGEFTSNWELSSARSTAVLRYLVEQGGIPAERVFAAGYGETQPVADNGSTVGRAANRRADIVILYPLPGDPTAPTATSTPASSESSPTAEE